MGDAYPPPLPTQQQLANIPERQMQIIVALGVVGGLGMAVATVDGIRSASTDAEREALRNVGKLAVGAVVVAAIIYALDIDKRWMTIESASPIIEKKIEENLK